jgi:hypothetical protein
MPLRLVGFSIARTTQLLLARRGRYTSASAASVLQITKLTILFGAGPA